MRFCTFACLILIFAAAAHAGEIDGTIYEAGQELEGASVTFAGQTTTTDAEGRFALENVPPGDRLLRITHPDGKRVKQASVIVLSDEHTPFTFDFAGDILTLGEVVCPNFSYRSEPVADLSGCAECL